MQVYLDSEGTPVQEFSAIYVNPSDLLIKDVFHRFVRFPFEAYDPDMWARFNVHGLNIDYLREHGVTDEKTLVEEFKDWLSWHPHVTLYAHAPAKEEKLLGLPIEDVKLLPWIERDTHVSHKVACNLKQVNFPVCNVRCREAHSSFVRWSSSEKYCNKQSELIKRTFGHHCSLYDSVECFLYHTENQKSENYT